MRVFISYNHNDAQFVDQLTHDLINAGAEIWFDKFEIKVGDSIPGKISEGLANSDIFLIVLSNKSVLSKWVFLELQTAINKHCEGRLDKILPVLIEQCQVPELIRHLKYADFTEEYSSALNDVLGTLNLPLEDAIIVNWLEKFSLKITKEWLVSEDRYDLTKQAHAEHRFIDLYRQQSAQGKEILKKTLMKYLADLLIYDKDIYTDERILVAARIMSDCRVADNRFVPLLIQHFEDIIDYGTYSTPAEYLSKALRLCWDRKYNEDLRRIITRLKIKKDIGFPEEKTLSMLEELLNKS